MTSACLAGWIAYIACFPKKILAKPRLLPAMTFALVLTGLSTATCAWLLVRWIMAWPLYVTVTVPLLLLSFGLALALFVGLTSNVLQDDDREWLSRAAAWLLLFIVAWAGASALVLLVPTTAAAYNDPMSLTLPAREARLLALNQARAGSRRARLT